MASPRSSNRLFRTPSPGYRPLGSPFSDDALWRRLGEAGFDEESIKRRDKAALIAYIAKLEAEMFNHQHHMGLILLERTEWASKYEQLKASAESSEMMYKREQAAHSCALAEARKKEDSLQKALKVEKECLMNVDKALHELRAEAAETKISAEIKLTEAHNTMESAQNKFSEAKAMLLAAESLQAEVNRYQQVDERKLREVEAREEDLLKRTVAFNSDCDAKEKDIIRERQSLSERMRFLQQGQERLLEEKASLNQREEHICSRSQELSCLAKELEASKANLEREYAALNEEKLNLELKAASLLTREEVIIEKEASLERKEQDLLVLQEKLTSKESVMVKNLLIDQEATLKIKESEFEAELQRKCRAVEVEIENKQRAWELKEVDLTHKEYTILEGEHDLEARARALAEKEKGVTEKFNECLDKQKTVMAAEKEVELQKAYLLNERAEINRMGLGLQQTLDSIESNRKQIDLAEEKLELMKSEANELILLETKLKEEIDVVRNEKHEILMEAEKLKAEKAEFETEWELIDEKRGHLCKEADRVADEKSAIFRFLEDERDCLKQEKDVMQEQYERDAESLRVEKEAFVTEMQHERSKWFNKIQQERADLLLDVEMKKRELMNRFDKRHEELESCMKAKALAFEHEREIELQKIESLKETVAKDLEQIGLERRRLESERVEISQDRAVREKEWSDLSNSIEELKQQQGKLEEQRESLHADHEKILAQFECLEKLENVKLVSDSLVAVEMENSGLGGSRPRVYAKKSVKYKPKVDSPACVPSYLKIDDESPTSATRFGWVKRCADLIFKNSHEKLAQSNDGMPSISEFKDECCATAEHLNQSNGFEEQKLDENGEEGNGEVKEWVNEPKVILEVPSTVKEVLNLNSGIKADASEGYAHSHSEPGFYVDKRKRAKGTFSSKGVDSPSRQLANKKKRKQGEDASQNLFEDIAADSVDRNGDAMGLLPIRNAALA